MAQQNHQALLDIKKQSFIPFFYSMKKGAKKISTVETHSGPFLAFIQTAHSQIRNYLKALRAGFDI
jgi:hypothetical protein